MGQRLCRKFFSLWLAIMGMLVFGFVLGAAVMFFELPGSSFMSKAFLGARAWREQRQVLAGGEAASPEVRKAKIDQPHKTFDGFTLYTCGYGPELSSRAFLINMNEQLVHTWSIAYSQIWPASANSRAGSERHRVNDALVCFFSTHLYANGDLIAVLQGGQHFINGYGLVKLDKESRVLWKYSGNAHHDIDVGEDGTIYALTHESVRDLPAGLQFVPTPCLVDYLVLLSPEGKELRKPISLLEAFRDSPYATLLHALERWNNPGLLPGDVRLNGMLQDLRWQDALHANSVKVLGPKLAARFPGLKAGQVLISMRHLNAIAVIDPDTRVVVWAAQGPWRGQHDAFFLDNGHLLLFDNFGLATGSRVLEYDPQTQAFPWSYAGENRGPFFTAERGMSQPLPNGNILIVNSEGREMFEVTRNQEVVWNCSTERLLCSARRYGPEQVRFLKGDRRARP